MEGTDRQEQHQRKTLGSDSKHKALKDMFEAMNWTIVTTSVQSVNI